MCLLIDDQLHALGGVELQWVTIEGAERVRLGFTHRARNRAELRMHLRGALDVHC